MKPEFDTRQ